MGAINEFFLGDDKEQKEVPDPTEEYTKREEVLRNALEISG